MKKPFICLVFLLSFLHVSIAQDYLASNEYFYRLINGLNLMVIEDENATDITLNLTFKTGLALDESQFEGMSFFFEQLAVRQLRKNLQERINVAGQKDFPVSIQGKTSLENLTIQLQFPEQRLHTVLQSIYTVMNDLDLSEESIKTVDEYVTAEYAQLQADSLYRLQQKVSGPLWKDFQKKRQVIVPPHDTLKNGIAERLADLLAYYYCPKNAILVIKTPRKAKPTFDLVNNVLNNLARCTYNYTTRYPVPEYRKLHFSSQLIDENPGNATPLYVISFQGPKSYVDRRSIVVATVFEKLISSPDSKLYQAFKDSAAISSVNFKHDILKYSSELSFIIYPDTHAIGKAYHDFWQILEQYVDTGYLDELNLGLIKSQTTEDFLAKQEDNRAHLDMVSNFWIGSSIDDYSQFAENIGTVTSTDIKKFVKSYFIDNHFVAGLSIDPAMRKAHRVDSAFTGTKDHIEGYRFHFLPNTARFENKSQDTLLLSLFQFLKINPDLKIKVNGVSHKSELLHHRDRKMYKFFKGLENFIIYPRPSANIRLDLYRSMTIIKQLIDAGIDATRLFGTGHLDKRTREDDNAGKYAYCTELK